LVKYITVNRLKWAGHWRNFALNREEWRKLLKKARAHAGLLSQL
jgi:hypothetical protein